MATASATTAPAVQLPSLEDTNTRDTKRSQFYNCKVAITTGIIQISCGPLAFLFDVIILASKGYRYGYKNAALGIWGGVVFIVCGIIGLMSSKKKRGMIVTYLVLSIFSSVIASVGVLFGVGHVQQPRWSNPSLAHRTASILYLAVMIVELLTGIIASSFVCAARICCDEPPVITETVVYMAPPYQPPAYNAPQAPMGQPPAYTPGYLDARSIGKHPIP